MSLSWNHMDGPNIDHIVPLGLGGPDAPWNVQLAHRSCNVRLNNPGLKLAFEMNRGLVRLAA